MSEIKTLSFSPTFSGEIKPTKTTSTPAPDKTSPVVQSNNLEKQPTEDTYIPQETTGETETAPKIGAFRLITCLLTDEQIAEINKTRKLPDNGKFIATPGGNGYTINYNLMNLRTGTKTLPEGFEVKRNILGFAVVLPKDTEGLFIKN